jgi:hypothetical protein
MPQAPGVGCLHYLCHFDAQLDHIADFEPPMFQHNIQRLALDVFHGQERPPVLGLADFVDDPDVRVGKPRRGLGVTVSSTQLPQGGNGGSGGARTQCVRWPQVANLRGFLELACEAEIAENAYMRRFKPKVGRKLVGRQTGVTMASRAANDPRC